MSSATIESNEVEVDQPVRVEDDQTVHAEADQAIHSEAGPVIDAEAEIKRSARLNEAATKIAGATRWSVAASLIPLPYVYLAALASVQASLVVDLGKLYDQPVTKRAATALISVLLGTLVPASASQAVAGALAKFVPGYGSAIGALSMAAFGTAATYAVGKVLVRHFESGGTFSSFSADAIREDLKKEFAAQTSLAR